MADLNANKVDDMLEALNRAIEIHTKNAVQGLPYNKSELVEIVDITERNLGKYIVWNGSARYQAFSENTTYEMGTKVYVNIPNDDFKEQKHIIGPYVADGESAVFYKNPLTDFQPLTGNILQDGEVGEKKSNYDTTYGLVANYNKQGKTVSVEINDGIQEVPVKDEVVEIYRAPDLNGSGYQGYKYIGISADFKTLLNTFSPIAGDYGIVVTIWHAVKYDVQEDSAIEKRDYFLSVKDMIGNVYNFNTYFKQAVLYDISAFGEVQSIIVGFYQRGNFIMSNNKEVPTHYTLNGKSHLLSDNILVRNVSVTFGDDLMEDNDRATIFTRNGSTYDPVQKDILNTKTIELRWTHLNSTSDEFENLDSSKASSQCGNYKIHWYEDSIHDRTDYIASVQAESENVEVKMKAYKTWDAIERNGTSTDEQIQEARINLINTFNLKQGVDYQFDTMNPDNPVFIGKIEERINQVISNAKNASNVSSSIAGDTLAGSGWKPIDVANTEWSIDFTPNYKRSYSKVMAIIEYDEGDTKHKIKSNILQFDNLRITSNSLSDDKASALRIGFSDGTDGDYPIYNGTTGELLSREDVTRDRKFQATCKSLIDDKDYLNGNETIIWQIPKTGSMILMNQTFLEENGSTLLDSTADEFKSFIGTLDYDAKYYYIKRSVSDSPNPVNSKQTYQIAPYYNKANTNNTIYCYIIKNSDIFKSSATLTFGQHGTSGTDYTFSLGFIQKIAPKKDENNNIIKDDNGNELWGEVVGQGDTALTIGDENYLEIGFELFNSKNEKIDLTPEQKNAIIKLWVDKRDSNNEASIDGFYSGLNLDEENNVVGNAEHLKFIITKNGNNYDRVAVKTNINDINKLRYIVLQAAVTNENVQNEESTLKSVKFIQLLPIHIRAAGTDWVLRGSDYIVYDDKGANPSCYNDYYQLIGSKGVKRTGFEIYFGADISEEAKNRGNYPQLIALNTIKENINGEEQEIGIDYKLQAPPLYINGLSKNIAITHEDNLYTCPLVILQNKYQIPAINNWNGELVVDNVGNKILASMVGAGHKNGDNTFTGVLMGDVNHDNEKLTGLFGYDAGARIFELNTNGKAFIGKSGNGRIYIDGNTGTIKSAARESSDIKGTEFNLAQNYIDVRSSSDNNLSRIHLDVTTDNDTEAYFSIDNDNGNRLMHIANDDYYLQTDNYSEKNKTGLKLDLKQGILNSYDKITINGGNESEIYFGNTNNFIKIGIDKNSNSYFQMEKRVVNADSANNALNSAITNLNNAFIAEGELTEDYRPVIDENGNNIEVPQVTDNEITNKKILNLKNFEDYCVLKNNFLRSKRSDLVVETESLSDMEEILNEAWINYDTNRKQKRDEYLRKIAQYQQYNDNISNIQNLKTELETAQNDFDYNTENSSKRIYFDGLTSILGESNEYLNEDGKTYNEYNDENIKNEYVAYEAAVIEINKEYNETEERLNNLYKAVREFGDLYEIANNNYLQAQQELASLNEDPDASPAQIQEAERIVLEKEAARTTAWTNYANKQKEYNDAYENSNIENLLRIAKDNENTLFQKREKYLNAKETLEQAQEVYDMVSNNSIGDTISDLIEYLMQSDNWKNLEENDLYLNNNEELAHMIKDGENVNDTSSIIINYKNENISYKNFNDRIANKKENVRILTNDCSIIEKGYNTLLNAIREYSNAQNLATGTSGSIVITNQGTERIKVGENFTVDDEGNIEAIGGTIGGWVIGKNYLKSANEQIFLLPGTQSRWRQVINGGLHTNWKILVGYNRTINVGSDYWDKNPDKRAEEYRFGINNEGEMFASAGKIGGWTIAPGWLSAGGNNQVVGMNVTKRSNYDASKGRLNWAFVAGAPTNSWADWDKAPFRVSNTGKLYASSANISGTITATAGSIGGCEIKDGVLKVSSANITSVNADTINTGTLSADRIAANSISASKIKVGTLDVKNMLFNGSTIGLNRLGVLKSFSTDAKDFQFPSQWSYIDINGKKYWVGNNLVTHPIAGVKSWEMQGIYVLGTYSL